MPNGHGGRRNGAGASSNNHRHGPARRGHASLLASISGNMSVLLVNQRFQILHERGLNYKRESIPIIPPSSFLSTANIHIKFTR